MLYTITEPIYGALQDACGSGGEAWEVAPRAWVPFNQRPLGGAVNVSFTAHVCGDAGGLGECLPAEGTL